MSKKVYGGMLVGFIFGVTVTLCIYPTKSQPKSPIPIDLKLCFEYYKWVEQSRRETVDMERYCSEVRKSYNK